MIIKEEYLETFTNLEPFTGKLQSFKDLRKTGETRSFKLRKESDPNKVIEKFEGRIIGFYPKEPDKLVTNDTQVIFEKITGRDESGEPKVQMVKHPMYLVDSDILQTANNESQDLTPED